MFDRISASFALARSSWDVLRSNKQFLLFPVLSGIGFILVVLSFVIPLGTIAAFGGFKDAVDAKGNFQPWAEVLGVALLFAFYFLTFYVIIFCNSALVSCAIMKFNGEEPTLGDGFRAAASRWFQILGVVLVSATVSVLLKMLENVGRRRGYSIGQFIASILGLAWSVITYFVVPILVVEKLGPFKAIGRSVEVLKKTWGEALVGHFTLGFFKFLAIIPFFILLFVGIFMIMAGQGAGAMLYLGIAVLVLAGLYFLVYAAVASAMDTIFTSALYQYAAFNTVPVGFDRDAMDNAFRQRR